MHGVQSLMICIVHAYCNKVNQLVFGLASVAVSTATLAAVSIQLQIIHASKAVMMLKSAVAGL